MQSTSSPAGALRFSTKDFPPADRLPFWREEFGRQIIRLDIDSQDEAAFEAQAELRRMPGLGMIDCRVTPSSMFKRTKQSTADGNDDIVIFLANDGILRASNRRTEFDVDRGQAFCVRHEEEAAIQVKAANWTGLMLDKRRMSALVSRLDQKIDKLISSTCEPLSLLRGYLDLTRNSFAGSSAVGEIVASHIYELVALTLGANSEGRELAASGGVRAARLRALKSAIIADPTISLSVLAERHRVTPRYVQMIFEESGSTFTNFSTERRLQKAFVLLSSTRCDGLKIASIAMQCGFGDLSHFNRTFKRRFGATPSEIRREWKR